MGKDFESSVCQWQPDRQFPNAKSTKLPFVIGMQNTHIHCTVPSSCTPNSKEGLLKKPGGWCSCLPQFKQGVIPNLTFHEKLLGKVSLPSEVNSSMTKNICAPKQFLVFDQSGNKTTMMFSSGVGNPIQPFNSLSPKATMTDELGEGSEMHEDTEEINALLYSDDDSEDGDSEETSTGHSPPSTMTAYEKQDSLDDNDVDKVASSYGPTKTKKLCDVSIYEPNNRYFEFEDDDAQSSCASNVRNGSMGSLSGNKRSRTEKIRETVNILQTIIPGGKGKDAVMVLDEAIDYLRTLRFKAKSLGLSSL